MTVMGKLPNYLVIDFDSTLVKVEALDELARIALATNEERDALVEEIVKITKMGMEGEIGFAESLARRIALFAATREDVQALIDLLLSQLTESVVETRELFKKYASRIYVISGGFKEYIVPVVATLGIASEHVLANDFVWDADRIIGVEKANYLSQDQGKVKQMRALNLQGAVWVIGDGITDYQICDAGLAEKFLAFVENVRRVSVVEKADVVLTDFHQLFAAAWPSADLTN